MIINEKFIEAVRIKIKKKLGNEYEVTSAIIAEENSKPYHNLLIRKKDSNVSFAISLATYFYEYMNTSAYLDDIVDEISTELKKYNYEEVKEEARGGYVRISKLPDGTFFHVTNGHWQGFVTTENGDKVCYAGASKKNPTKEYVRRFIPDEYYRLVIEIL